MSAGWYGAARGLGIRPLGVVSPQLAAAALADWLFWGHGIGLSFAAFCAALAAMAHLVRPFGSPQRGALALVIMALGFAPAVEHLAPLSVAFALIATAAAAGLALPVTSSVPRASLEAALRWIAGPRRVCQDLDRHARWRRRARVRRVQRWTGWLAWLLPLAAGSVFLALFSDANPVCSAAIRMTAARQSR